MNCQRHTIFHHFFLFNYSDSSPEKQERELNNIRRIQMHFCNDFIVSRILHDVYATSMYLCNRKIFVLTKEKQKIRSKIRRCKVFLAQGEKIAFRTLRLDIKCLCFSIISTLGYYCISWFVQIKIKALFSHWPPYY